MHTNLSIERTLNIRFYWLLAAAHMKQTKGNRMSDVQKMRSAQETAKRLLVLASVCAVADDSSLRKEVIHWLQGEGIWSAVSSAEKHFLENKNPSQKEVIDYSWRAEAFYVLGWALGLEPDLQPPTDQASSGNILEQIPAPGESVATFVNEVMLRPASEIQNAAEDLYNAHSRCRAAEFQNRTERHGYDIEVAQERHRAINWLICYQGADWDDVATDT